jgi:hypothetical protein
MVRSVSEKEEGEEMAKLFKDGSDEKNLLQRAQATIRQAELDSRVATDLEEVRQLGSLLNEGLVDILDALLRVRISASAYAPPAKAGEGEKTCRIYVLIDPRGNQPKYVGMTTKSLSDRMKGHGGLLRGNQLLTDEYEVMQTAYHSWMRNLKQNDLFFNYTLLETVAESSQALERENFWIIFLASQGYALVNMLTPAQQSAVAKLRWASALDNVHAWHPERDGT